MKKLFLCSLFFIYWLSASAQYKPQGSGNLLQRLEKFKVVGTALYVAAHPDDENTLLITWLANEKKVRTGYLALTRGDGGQNLLGTEKGEFAGLLRTNELLEARNIDGGEQFFSRANDFGYTKTTEEALATWGEEQILSDMVYRIRKFQPDVIITRFPPDERAGHGHHSASSLLAEKAFDAAADPKAFPEQLKELKVWQAKRLVWNFYNRGFKNTPPDDDSKFIQVDIGGYNTLLGASYGEIGSKARSMHRSQGFGSGLYRGERLETLRHTKGEAAEKDLFDGVNTSWSRIPGGEMVEKAVSEAIKNFRPELPSASIPALSQVYTYLNTLPKSNILAYKKEELEKLMLDFSGLYAEVIVDNYAFAPDDTLSGTVRLINRSDVKIEVEKIVFPEINLTLNPKKLLENNVNVSIPFKTKLPSDFSITQPYWLWEEHPIGYYILKDEKLRGLPLSPAAINAKLTFNLDGTEIAQKYQAQYKYVEPSFGEIYRPLEIRPTLTVTPSLNSLVFHDTRAQEIRVSVKSAKDNVAGKVSLKTPAGWTCSPSVQSVILEHKFDETVLTFKLTPPEIASKAEIEIQAEVEGEKLNRGLNTIKYSHVPEITSFPKARIHAIKLDLKTHGTNVAYIMGAGDEVPTALEQMGYKVTLIDENGLNENINFFDAILIGVRAYNTKPWLPFYHDKLMNYVKNGGNLICQYQTNGGSDKWIDKMGPYKMSLGRDRVSEEDADVQFLPNKSNVLNQPNQITKEDFEGWIQERGLYFAQDWDKEHYESVFSMHDKNESEKLGSTLIAKYGKGNFVYTGLSFFRELPAGVPGAYRLMANLISLQ